MSFGMQLLIICPLLFLAGFIDSVAGGGGLISTPAYMLAGLPMHEVLGTNKVSAALGTGLAAGKYIKSGKVEWRTAIISSILSFAGSFAGSQIALMIDRTMLKTAFKERCSCLVGSPLTILGLSKLSKQMQIPLYVKNVLMSGYPTTVWMVVLDVQLVVVMSLLLSPHLICLLFVMLIKFPR